jgi:hypothetical protein
MDLDASPVEGWLIRSGVMLEKIIKALGKFGQSFSRPAMIHCKADFASGGKKLFGCQKRVYGILDGEKMGWLFDDCIKGGTIVGRTSGTHHHGRGGGTQFDDMRHFTAGHSRHHVVGQNKVVERGIETGERLACTICTIHLVSEVVEKQLGQKADVNVIINEQHGS